MTYEEGNSGLKSIMPVTLRVGLGVWMSGVILGTFLLVPPAKGFPSPEAARIVVFHVPCAMVAVIGYIVSLVYAIGYLLRGDLLSDAKSAISAGLGFLFTALATVTGMIFAQSQWGAAWNWDPRETSILMLVMVYAAYFTLRSCVSSRVVRARVSAVYNILAGLVMPYLVFIVPRVMGGLHPSDTFTSGGLSPEYRIALLCAAIGFVWLYIWVFRMQVRIAESAMAARRSKVE